MLALTFALALLAARLALGQAGDAPPAPPGATAVPPPGSKLTDAKASCLVLNGLKDAVIENLDIGPCAGNGIELIDSHNVTIRDVRIDGTGGSGIYVLGSSSIRISESRITDTISGIYAVSSTVVDVSCNTIENPRGPIPRGQFVQFDTVSGADNRISCNVGRNEPGRGQPEDAISLYKSDGTPQSPITVTSNLIVGGGPSESGGGIMLGDDGGSYLVAEDNVLIDPGQYGIGVASGNNIAIRGNIILGRKQAFTNVGIYTWNQYPHACHSITVEGNTVKWISKYGRPNPYWNGENCGRINGIIRNNFAGNLTPEIAKRKPAGCACKSEGFR
jgi:parallel beta-helix repeat protein